LASQLGHIRCVEALLKAGANAKAVDVRVNVSDSTFDLVLTVSPLFCAEQDGLPLEPSDLVTIF
jgi:hypothetical protein